MAPTWEWHILDQWQTRFRKLDASEICRFKISELSLPAAEQCGNHWICGDFFFTDRGKHTQKNMEGVLQQILCQPLSQVGGLVSFIERIFKQHPENHDEGMLTCLETALMQIVRQRTLRVNICLSIHALDE